MGVAYASSIFLGISISTSSYNLYSSLLSLVIVQVSKSFSLFHFYTLPTLDVKYLKTPIYLKGSLKNNLFSSEMYHAEDFVCLTKRIVRTYHSYGRKKLLLAVTAVYKFITGKSVTIVFQFCDHHSFVYHYLMLFLIIQTLTC